MSARIAQFMLLAWLCAVAPVAFAQSAASAQHFVEQLYGGYTLDGNPTDLRTSGRDAIASPSLLALIRKDQQVMRGEAGYLDMDPLCQCQDFDIKDTLVKVHMRTKSRADADVSFSNYGAAQQVMLSLVWHNGRWRIDDVSSANDARSLREALTQEIREYGGPVRKQGSTFSH
ncbi:DUF3828 domain-containing protein [Paraburkholderia rhizosphaerae]|uniref:Uncharacterized protein DUF3828 n=1 Tax=Paraburkholderia rhizosphaerae TaxID=480658 RepID=A0A4R8LBF4_9BURK|nr:DUF3828 domain-containing protein [Paraburkholderia rhizosphaerae]TDY40266.1 uncharacterized protein DUF3828 [Paraburkholderia rhizosphaerae]